MFDKSPLTPLCQRGESKEISPFGKGGFYKLYITLFLTFVLVKNKTGKLKIYLGSYESFQ
ncbi:MAG: hypothetical protein A2Y81_05420 [Nitrospirae bacterium RBG_13_43_8]|nr:MAG: hypothetical protein A2Y81_05420 [Nitrospirae bacterium RBG_13_43_8]